jgi:phosphoglucosamine mutase
LVRALPRGATPLRILTGRDTRESGTWIEREIACGARTEDASVLSAGVVPTPAVAYLTQAAGYDLGIVISASHNSFEDNGIKVFSGGGEKLTDPLEQQVEAIVADTAWAAPAGEAAPVAHVDLTEAYLDHLRGVFPESGHCGGLRLGVDCANGAAVAVAPRLFGGLGIFTVMVGDHPDGRNINLDCGSTHPEGLSAVVVGHGCHLGVAFDGDGDRAVFVDHQGHVVNGDAVLLMCARQLQAEGRLKGSAVVATVMSNIGLEIALHSLGIALRRCPVGDKHVMEQMLEHDLALGGEQSGHIIFSDYLFTGDGLCTALNVLRVIAITGRSLADLASDLKTYPQILVNVPVREKVDFAAVPGLAHTIRRVEERLRGHGRLLVRYSGTEPLLRIMLEGPHEPDIRAWAQEIAETARQSIGAPVIAES